MAVSNDQHLPVLSMACAHHLNEGRHFEYCCVCACPVLHALGDANTTPIIFQIEHIDRPRAIDSETSADSGTGIRYAFRS